MRHEQRSSIGAVPRNLAAFNTDFQDTDRGGLLDLPPLADPPAESSQPAERPGIDLGVVADKVVASLAGQVPRERVERLLVELLEQELSGARVTLFLPIFLHRLACESLHRERAAGAAGGHAAR
jgi:hypothetical protein